MRVRSQTVVIVGGGLAAVRTAEALREFGYGDRLVMLSEESRLPYDRPPLSKGYLHGKSDEAQIQLLSERSRDELQLETHLLQRAVGIDRKCREIKLGGGESVPYGRLVVATGARPVRLAQLQEFGNVHVLRNLQDASHLRQALRGGGRIGIIGAGFIGLEIAAAAKVLGCDVIVMEAAAAPLAAILGEELGRHVQRWHESKGVKFRCHERVSAVHGEGNVNALSLSSGETFDVDAVVVGVGQIPNVEWLLGSGLEIQQGLVCDEYGGTADPDIRGVGDAVCTKIGEEYFPTRQWTAVTEQARRVASVMCGQEEPGPVVQDFYFWSDQHGSRLQFAGRMPDRPQLKWIKGGPQEERFLVLGCTATEVRAVLSLASPREFLANSVALRRGENSAPPIA